MHFSGFAACFLCGKTRTDSGSPFLSLSLPHISLFEDAWAARWAAQQRPSAAGGACSNSGSASDRRRASSVGVDPARRPQVSLLAALARSRARVTRMLLPAA